VLYLKAVAVGIGAAIGIFVLIFFVALFLVPLVMRWSSCGSGGMSAVSVRLPLGL
jgi:hypothetical protein